MMTIDRSLLHQLASDATWGDGLVGQRPEIDLRLRVIELLCSARNVTPDRLIQTASAVVQYVASGTVPGRPIVGADGMDSHG